MREIHVKILRGTGSGVSAYQSYLVPVEDDAAVSIMNLLEEIYSKQDPTLAFFSHAACRQAACGKCAVRANGKVVLACKTRADDDEIVLEPYKKDVIRDLICKA